MAAAISNVLDSEPADRQALAEYTAEAAAVLSRQAAELADELAHSVILGPVLLGQVLGALADAAEYRSTHGGLACFDCAAQPGHLCADHAADHDRASAYDELAGQLRHEASQ